MLFQPPLPPEYASLETSGIHARIAARKAQLGGSLCILGHHYQSDDVIQYADFVGDSLKLSRQAASQAEARYIVFCGVHFMAESADILSQGRAAVILPHMMAGCGMADMAEDDAVALALDELRYIGGGAKVVPISYVNSTAAIKALTARAGGACCTSSNVRNVFAWALGCGMGVSGCVEGVSPMSGCVEGVPPSCIADILSASAPHADKILAVPDRHLAFNTALAMGFAADDCVLYDPKLHHGGLADAQVRRARFILWKGQCYVHQRFTPAHVRAVRQSHPGIRVIVHPECPHEVVALADATGSTEQIIQAVTDGCDAPGAVPTAWAIGTESNLVNRLAKRFPGHLIRTLGDAAALCIQMARIDPIHLLWVLDNLVEGRVVNQVKVAPQIAADARVALERMISIKSAIGLSV